MNRSILPRLAKLEAHPRMKPARRFVFRHGEEAEARAQGLPYAVMPRRCTSSEEWIALYAPARRSSRTERLADRRTVGPEPVRGMAAN
jgi:hypothetical protein